jgi:hypothetical protein
MGSLISKKPIVSFDYIDINKEIILINTLDVNMQECLIINTTDMKNEETIINSLDKNKSIVIYGKNCRDIKPYNKYNQLKKFGFINVFIYNGGLFEWLLLQEVFGEDNFQTTIQPKDILIYK